LHIKLKTLEQKTVIFLFSKLEREEANAFGERVDSQGFCPHISLTINMSIEVCSHILPE